MLTGCSDISQVSARSAYAHTQHVRLTVRWLSYMVFHYKPYLASLGKHQGYTSASSKKVSVNVQYFVIHKLGINP